jgi:hypothetical protein
MGSIYSTMPIKDLITRIITKKNLLDDGMAQNVDQG